MITLRRISKKEFNVKLMHLTAYHSVKKDNRTFLTEKGLELAKIVSAAFEGVKIDASQKDNAILLNLIA